MKIFVGSLPWSIEEAELSKYFEKYGEVTSTAIIKDKFSGRSKGFGFIEMADDEAAKKAIAELNGTDISGRAVVVNEAQEKTDRPKRDFNRGGFGGGGNRGGGYGSKGGYGNKGGGYGNKGGNGNGGDRW
ncbi:MAG: RNA-binding protein [Chitinophagales bacterium]